MSRFRLPPQIAPVMSLVALMAAMLACSLPFQPGPAQPTVSAPPAATEVGGAGEGSEIPASVLTQVAATMFAPHQATWTAQAALPPTSTLPAKPAAPAQPTQAIPTDAVAPSPTSQPTQAQQPTPTAPPATTAPQATPTNVLLPTAYQPTYPPASFTSQSGKAFTVFGVNLVNCGGTYAANFLIENTGTQVLESLSLQFTDLSSDEDIYGPNISDEPFMWTDRTCTPGGIDRLEAGDWLFAGGLLGPGQLSGHTILANFLFCTAEDLNGQCFPRSVEFVVP